MIISEVKQNEKRKKKYKEENKHDEEKLVLLKHKIKKSGGDGS